MLNPDGTFRLVITVPVTTAAAADEPRVARDTRTLTVHGTLINGVLSGAIDELGLSFSAPILSADGPTAGIAGYYSSSTIGSGSGETYSIVGTNKEVLVVATTPTVSTGGRTTLNNDGTFALQNASNGGTTSTVSIQGTVDAPSVTVSGTIIQPGQPAVDFAGVNSALVRTDRIINLSSRLRVGDGERLLITGFVVGGTEPKPVLVRAVGPTLASVGVAGAMPNPRIRIYRGSELVAENDDWGANAATRADLAEAFARIGAFGLPASSTDAAFLTTLAPGTYTAQITGGNGVALAEIYDASVNPQADYQRLINISTRGEAGPGEGVLIGGFVLTGNAPKKLLVRGAGPALAAAGVASPLADPILRVYRNGVLVAENDNWSATAADAATLADAAKQTGAFAFATGSKDAALLLTLQPGNYTAQVSGAGTTTGIALVEIYELSE